MKKIEKYLVLFSAPFAVISAILYAVFFEHPVLSSVFSAIFIITAAIFVFVFWRIVKRKKILKRIFSPMLQKIRSAYKKISLKIKNFLPKHYDDSKSYVLGKDEIKLRLSFFSQEKRESRKKAKIKLPKYESIKTDKDRVRYLYTAFLCHKSERGYRVDPTRTPNEISTDFSASPEAKALFEAYPTARYTNDEEAISKETLEYLEKNIEH